MIQSKFEELKPRRHRHSSLAIHPYFGKVDPSIVAAALEHLSSPLQTILDPFCGSGTVIHDALLAQRSVIGFDSSPLACMIATAKVLGITASEEIQLAEIAKIVAGDGDLFDKILTHGRESSSHVPQMPRVRSVSDWFGENSLRELARIRDIIESFRDQVPPEVYIFARIAFSRIITQASYQKGESTYSRTVKEDSSERVRKLFKSSVGAVLKSARAFTQEMRDNELDPPCSGRLIISDGISTIKHGAVQATIVNRDARETHDQLKGKIAYDLIITSPPYLMSWDYGLYHKFRFYWLGFDLDSYEETEIGRHLRRRNDDVVRYRSDMASVFASMHPLANQSAQAVFVNAPSVVHGQLVDTNVMLRQCAELAGWRYIGSTDSVAIPGPHHGMYASLEARSAAAPGQAGKREHVLVFEA
ncbi:DNA methyltransferase [Pseudomonas siliginis]|uniref:DNA methyltransferase n=1 Tax=Pseudomonas siliginis TaxID=2842346 RepID=UPI002093180E|nr:DNA methyltransferase [Pseudomonas siliginis]USU01353.1 site-specific DNA-methyltransferase [Pseudomonas siliginis]